MTQSSLTLTFRFLDGAYVGHDHRGNVERYPSPLRLHAALLNAAGRGSTAVPGIQARTARGSIDPGASALTSPSPQARAALAWMEHHPPTRIVLPNLLGLEPRESTAFLRRDRARAGKYQLPDEVTVTGGQPVDGPMVFHWDSVPEEHVAVLSTLAEEIGYLGESVSVVACSASTEPLPEHPVERTFLVDTDAAWAEPGVTRFAVPTTGRTQHLIDAFETHYRPSLIGGKGKPAPDVAPSGGTESRGIYARDSGPDLARKNSRGTVGYRRALPGTATSIWDSVYLLPVVESLAPDEHVEVSVRLHRALVRMMPEPLPVVTGTYAPGTATANHLAIQPVPRSFVDHLGRVGEEYGSVILVMVPSETPPAEEAMISTALQQIGGRASLYAARHGQIKPGVPDLNVGPVVGPVAASEFWPESPTGEREWITYPLAVSESASTSTCTETVQVSMALVQRDRINVTDLPGRVRVPDLRRALIAAAREAETTVEGFRVVETTPDTYVHKTPKGLTVRLYQAKIRSRYLGDQELSAIGQTRHLGGGLLIPADL